LFQHEIIDFVCLLGGDCILLSVSDTELIYSARVFLGLSAHGFCGRSMVIVRATGVCHFLSLTWMAHLRWE